MDDTEKTPKWPNTFEPSHGTRNGDIKDVSREYNVMRFVQTPGGSVQIAAPEGASEETLQEMAIEKLEIDSD